MTTPEIFVLTAAEKQSPVWQRLHNQLQIMLANVREQNDHVQPDNYTNFVRGKIAVLKDLISLNEDRPPYGGE